jgi:hypothetical protein
MLDSVVRHLAKLAGQQASALRHALLAQRRTQAGDTSQFVDRYVSFSRSKVAANGSMAATLAEAACRAAYTVNGPTLGLRR